MKLILQHDERDCGAACLAMIAGNFGYFLNLGEFRELTNTDQNGTSVYNIINAALSLGLTSKALSGNGEELLEGIEKNEFRVPFIAHIITEDNYNHFVVVSSINRQKVRIFDPAKGKVTESFFEFINKWTGTIVTFETNDDFKKNNNEKRETPWLLSLLKEEVPRIFPIVILSFLISAIGIGGAFIFQFIVDYAVKDSLIPVDGIFLIFFSLIILYVFSGIIQYIRGRIIISMTRQIDLNITVPYFDRIMDMPMSQIIKRRTGEYISRYSDISAIREMISNVIVTMIIDVVMVLGCGIVLAMESLRLFGISVAIVLLYFLVVMLTKGKIKTANRRFMERNAYVLSYMKECVEKTGTIKSLNAEDKIKKSMGEKFNSYMDCAVNKSHIAMLQEICVGLIETIGIVLIIWQGFALVIHNQISLGTLISFYALLGYFISPIKNLLSLQVEMQTGFVAAERLKDILNIKREEQSGFDIELIKPIDEWKVSNISYRYGEDTVIDNLSFSFKRGDRVFISGKSGSGKTTLAKIFVRFLEEESGSITAKGVSLVTCSPQSVRNIISYVSGDEGLFSGTLFDNLTLVNPECKEEFINRICTITGIDKIINGMENLKTFNIEEGGVNLSRGQRQRIAFARALLRKPELIILDEATSNLDFFAEKELLDQVKSEFPLLTILMISHRRESMEGFDKVVNM